MKENHKHRTGLCRCILFFMLALFVTAGVSSTMPKVQVYAASKKNMKSRQKSSKKTGKKNCSKVVRLANQSGEYLIDTGHNWWLKDKNGEKITGMQYIKMPAKKKLKSGYYMFDDRGCLCRKKEFHRVDTVIYGKKFKGTYYFGGDNGRLYNKAGWKTINGKRYLLNSDGKRYENRWKSGYYFKSNGTIAKNKKISDGVYVDCDGRKCTEADMKINSLKKKLRKMLNGYYGSWSVYVKDLKTGGVVNLNESAMYSASVIKPFVMASTFDQIKKGNLKYNSTVKDKYTKTGCHHTLHPASSASVGDGQSNITSAKDCGILLEHIYNGTCVSSKYSKEMRKLLLAQTRRWKIPSGIPSGIKVANKTGETSSVEHDMAIVYGKKKIT